MGVIPLLAGIIAGALVGGAWAAHRVRRRHFSAIVDSVEGPDGTVYYRGTYCEIAAPDDDEPGPDGEPPGP